MEKYIFTSTKSVKVLKFLAECLPSYKYSDFVNALSKKDIIVNKNRIKKDDILNVGDVVEVYLKNASFDVPIFYQDDNIIVFNKGRKIEVCDGDFNIKNEYEKTHNCQIFPSHRLDAGTSGLVVFAKSKKVEKMLIDIFKNHQVNKYYYAVVSGAPKRSESLQGYLLKDAQNAKVKILNQKTKGAWFVETDYELKKQKDDISLLNVKIVMGKTHQIRAQLSYAGLPIVGDDKYGTKEVNRKYKFRYQLLQAYKIEFNLDSNNPLNYLNDVKFEIKCEFKNLFD